MMLLRCTGIDIDARPAELDTDEFRLTDRQRLGLNAAITNCWPRTADGLAAVVVDE